jgi:serine protease Do
MPQLNKISESEIEKRITRKLFLAVSAFTLLALLGGVGIGILVSQRRAAANENGALPPAEAISQNFVDVAKQVEPAVVNIDSKGKTPEVAVNNAPGGQSGDLSELFRQQRRALTSVGSGFIVDSKGLILTNAHVVEDSARVTVRLQSGEEYVATIVGTDRETDLAVLRINAGRELPTVRLGDSKAVQVGDWALAIGSPFGLAQTVTAGIISQTNRATPYATVFQKFIQTDAAINRGNSGGPLVNMRGEVIGVNSQIASTTGDYNGIGFALPSNEAAYVYGQILALGKVRRGYLGVNLESVKSEFGKVYEMPELKGAIVTSVEDKQSPAALAGLLVNDIVTQINGQPVVSAQDLIARIASTPPAQEAKVNYLREVNNKLTPFTANVKLAERPSLDQPGADAPDKPKPLPAPGAKTAPAFGLNLAELTPQLATSYKLEGQKGVLLKGIEPGSFTEDVLDGNFRASLMPGDLVQRINRVGVADLKTFGDIAAKLKPGDAVVLHTARYNRITQKIQQRIVQFTVQ